MAEPFTSLRALVAQIGVLFALMFVAIAGARDYPVVAVIAALLCILFVIGVAIAYARHTLRTGCFVLHSPVFVEIYRSERPRAFWLLYSLQIALAALGAAMGLLVIFHKVTELLG